MANIGHGRKIRQNQNEDEFRNLSGPRIRRSDVFEAVTDQILAKLEAGVVPWQTPSLARVGLPRNLSTGKAYSGINIFLLGAHEFQSPYFLTFLQARELGGCVRKGERGMLILKVGTYNDQEHESDTPDDATDRTIKRRFLRAYIVFNACQIDGIDFPRPPEPETFTPSAMAEKAASIVAAMPMRPAIYEGRKAYPHYIPSQDIVEMPSRETFRAEWRYFKTLFHELGHATGHEKRLNRSTLTENLGIQAAGSARKFYCQEELVAEMTAAFLSMHAGIVEDDLDNSAAYLKGWMDVLQVLDHRTWVVKAAAEAQKAANFILGNQSLAG